MKRILIICALMIFCVACGGMAQNGAMMRAYNNYKKGDYEDVLKLTSQAQSYKQPSHVKMAEILFLRALALEKLGRDQEARGVFKFIANNFMDTEYGYRAKEKVKADPDDAWTYYQQGSDYCNNGQFDMAISQFNKALELNPDYLLAYLNRGIAYGQRGNIEKALSDFNKSISLDPGFYLAYYNRGFTYKLNKQIDMAVSDFNKAIELNPQFALAYYNRADSYKMQSSFGKAISDYNRTIELNAEYVAAYNDLAYLLATCPDGGYRDGTKAIELAEKALEKSHDNSMIMDTLAAAYAEAGKFKDAVITQERAIDLMKKQGTPGDMIDGLIKRLNFYKEDKPWRE